MQCPECNVPMVWNEKMGAYECEEHGLFEKEERGEGEDDDLGEALDQLHEDRLMRGENE